MNKTAETEFLKLFNCCTETGTEALCAFAVRRLLSNYGDDFTKFLENNRHYFYHQWIDKKILCCDCPQAGCSIKKTHKMENWIFRKFYSDTGKEDTNHVIKTGGVVSQKCIHRYTVQNINIDELDISVLYYLLYVSKLGTLSQGEQNAIATLNLTRTQLSHSSSTSCFTDAKLNDMWRDFEIAVLDLTHSSYHKTFRKQIQLYKEYVLNNEEIVKLKNEMEKITSELQDIKGTQSADNNVILNYIDISGDGIKQHFSDQIAKTQEVFYEVADTVRKEALKMHECSKTNFEALNDQHKAMRQTFEEFIFEVKNKILVKLHSNIPVKKLYPAENIKGENDCAVLWQFETPEGFDVENAEVILKDVTTFKGEKFKVHFVRKGSLIMMTTVSLSVLYNKEKFEAAVKSFLSRLADVCNINTDQVCELVVTLHLLTTDEVNFSLKIPSTDNHIQRDDKAIQVDDLTECTKCLKLSLRNEEIEKELIRLKKEQELMKQREQELIKLEQKQELMKQREQDTPIEVNIFPERFSDPLYDVQELIKLKKEQAKPSDSSSVGGGW